MGKIGVKRVILYLHGKDGSAAKAEWYRSLCAGGDVVGVDYRRSRWPFWTAG